LLKTKPHYNNGAVIPSGVVSSLIERNFKIQPRLETISNVGEKTGKKVNHFLWQVDNCIPCTKHYVHNRGIAQDMKEGKIVPSWLNNHI
jgi:hypothetical protein